MSQSSLEPVDRAIVQDHLSGEVLDVVSLTPGQLASVLESRKMALGSDPLPVASVSMGPGGFVLIEVEAPDGNAPTAFSPVSSGEAPGPFLARLERVIETRRSSTAERSYTRSLLDGGAAKIGKKLNEEATELVAAVAGESDDRVANEAADVLFHLLVGLRFRDLPWRAVIEVLSRRFGTSGHEEKASRRSAP